MKAAVRLYPVDVALLPWSPIGDAGVLERVLTSDASGSVVTRVLTVPAGVPLGLPAQAPVWRELYVFAGDLSLAGRRFGPGAFLCRDAGSELPALRALTAATVIEFQEARRPGGDKLEATIDSEQAAALPWLTPDDAPEGLVHRVLAEGPGGSLSRVLRVDPFVSTGIFQHDHAEEVLMLEGSYKMGEEFHPAGTFTAKGPGVDHGPFLTHEGYLGLEVRNYA